jgi:UDP-N-acetylglucosamine:LPS N-acetylglucosamine transferase
MEETDMAPTRRKRILLALTGGGHFFQAQQLARHLQPEADLVLAVTAEWQAAPVAQRLGVPLKVVPPFQNYGERNPFSTLANFFKSLAAARRAVSEVKPDAVIAVGTNVSLPLFLAARPRGIPCMFFESITWVESLSATARLLSTLRLTDRIYVQWPELADPARRIFYEGTVL